MKKYFLLMFAVSTISYSVQQADDNTPVAKVGPITITKKEFLSRYELTPGLQRHRNVQADKAEFLLSLIAEKLLVLKARQEGWDADSVVSKGLYEVERNLVRDELYRREVMNKTTVSEKEIDEGLKKSSVDYKVYFLFSPSKKTADSLSAVISQGKNLEDFAHNGSGNSQWEIDSAIARWGDVDERMEQQIYAMKLNETSRPFPLDDGWYIVKLIGKTMTFMTGKEEEENKRERVVSVIRHRKEMKRMSAYMERALKNTSTTIETKLFNEIVVRCWNIVFTRYQRLDTMLVPIDHEIVSSMISSLPDRGKGVLVVFPDGYWSAKKTLEKVAQSGLTIPHPSQRSLSLLLEQRIKDLIDQEYLTRIGYQMKLNQSSAVRNDLAVWRDAFIAGDVRNRIGDTISVSQKDIREIQSVFKADSIVVRSDSAAEAKSRSLKLADDVNRIAGSTANDQPITIFRPTLDSLQVTRTPAMVFRILGFGGRMFAVPFVNPQVGWIQYWQKKEEVLP